MKRQLNNIYFAKLEPKELSSSLIGKASKWFDRLETNRYLDKIRASWCAYHGAYFGTDGHEITFSGDQGELVNLGVNHYRNLGQHMLVMITGTRPSIEARSINTDSKSLTQAILANELLDYYMREKRLEDVIHRAAEYAISLGTGYVKMDWNATSKQDEEPYDFNEETQTEIRQGDVEFRALSPLDVVYDNTKEHSELHDWVLTRTFKNRFDIAAKYPSLEQEILGVPTKSEEQRYRFDITTAEETDDIAVYEFYHKRTESMPEGRYQMFLEGDIVLLDAPMPYRKLPVYRISPSDILGTPYGYTPLFDLIPLQDAANSLISTLVTNNNAFGVQNIAIPQGCDIIPTQIAGGLNMWSYNKEYGEPKAVQLTASAPETYKLYELIERAMETISGINSVSRGNPQASLESGSALALIQSMSIQFINGLQQSYVRLIEDCGTGLINMLQDFASVPRISAIVGRTNKTKMRKFTGDDLSTVNRVICDVGNPLARSVAGRVQMAETLMQYGQGKFTVDQYFQVVRTGKLDTMTEGSTNYQLLMQEENERLVDGTAEVRALWTDQHKAHIDHHLNILGDLVLRGDVALVERVLAHIQEHFNLLTDTDPMKLMLLGQQPIQPPMPQQQGGDLGPVANMNQPPDAANPPVEDAGLPQMPQIPEIKYPI